MPGKYRMKNRGLCLRLLFINKVYTRTQDLRVMDWSAFWTTNAGTCGSGTMRLVRALGSPVLPWPRWMTAKGMASASMSLHVLRRSKCATLLVWTTMMTTVTAMRTTLRVSPIGTAIRRPSTIFVEAGGRQCLALSGSTRRPTSSFLYPYYGLP